MIFKTAFNTLFGLSIYPIHQNLSIILGFTTANHASDRINFSRVIYKNMNKYVSLDIRAIFISECHGNTHTHLYNN
jgi:hypothetical protein